MTNCAKCEGTAILDSMCSRCWVIEWREDSSPITAGGGQKDQSVRWLEKTGYVRCINEHGHFEVEHRYVMRRLLGRSLAPGENVHHINGDRADNRIDNLELWYSAQPYGQRVEDLIAYMVEYHSDRLREALGQRTGAVCYLA